MPGRTAPFANGFDPAQFLKRCTNVREVKALQEAEFVHARTAMLAVVGFVLQEHVQSPPLPFPQVSGPAIYHLQQVEAQGAILWEPVRFAIALSEAYRVVYAITSPGDPDFPQLQDSYEPGNLGFDPLGLLPGNAVAQHRLRSMELNNGRLAMIAICGFVAQELVSTKKLLESTS